MAGNACLMTEGQGHYDISVDGHASDFDSHHSRVELRKNHVEIEYGPGDLRNTGLAIKGIIMTFIDMKFWPLSYSALS